MRIWLDDERDAPRTNEWTEAEILWDAICLHADDAIALLKSGRVTFISLDHWMQPGERNGMDVARFIYEGAKNRTLPKLTWEIHTGDVEKFKEMWKILKAADTEWSLWQ